MILLHNIKIIFNNILYIYIYIYIYATESNRYIVKLNYYILFHVKTII